MDDSLKRSVGKHGLVGRVAGVVRRYRKAVLLRALYGAATATGTTAVGLIVLVLQRHL